MLYNFQRKRLYRHLLVGGAVCIAGLGMYSCSDKYDLDTKQPSNYNSIYGYMSDQGNFSYYLRLIDDLSQDPGELNQKEILSKTGSKTLFVADDDAFAEFFKSNKWGVKSYEELTKTQKKILLYSSMIDNPYPVSMLSTAQGPVTGEVCRRMSSLDVLDSVPVISTTSDELPQTSLWKELQSSRSEVVLFKDASGSNPMIHFTPKFLEGNRIESSDVDFLYNDPAGTRATDDAYVDDAKIINANIVCKNGFIHQVNKVILPLDNMAEIIRSHANMSTFSRILERFAAPIYAGSAQTLSYNNKYSTSVDSVFEKRYFSKRSKGSTTTDDAALNTDKNGNTVSGALKYDPGWNTYVSTEFSNRTAMMEDMGVMLVPTNEAINEWWNNGSGKVIKDYYGEMDSVPMTTFDDLINNGMLVSLVKSVPSRFEDVNNDAQMSMGITTADVDSVFLGCNGAVYLTNKVFAPAAYSSVLFPTIVNEETMNLISTAIEEMEYNAYLNSMVATYSFFIPTNNGMLTYIDPVSYGQQKTLMWEFHFDKTRTAHNQIYADVYQCEQGSDGKWHKVGERVAQKTGSINGYDSKSELRDRIENLLDNIIVIGEVKADQTYYVTKGNNYVKVGGNINQVGMKVYGSWQEENEDPLEVTQIYEMENGRAYVLEGVVMGTRKAVTDVLAEHSEFSDFSQVLQACGLVSTTNVKDTQAAGSPSGNIIYSYTSGTKNLVNYIFNNYQYTMYVPTNTAMQYAYSLGMPTLDDLTAAEELDAQNEELNKENEDNADWTDLPVDSADHIRSVWRDFVKYHIHDNSIFVDNGFSTGNYESAKSELKQLSSGQYSSGKPYKVQVESVSKSGLSVKMKLGDFNNPSASDFSGASIPVRSDLNNMMACEWWFAGSTDPEKATTIESSSFVVMHAIDRPLMYDADQFKYVERKVVDSDDANTRK